MIIWLYTDIYIYIYVCMYIYIIYDMYISICIILYNYIHNNDNDHENNDNSKYYTFIYIYVYTIIQYTYIQYRLLSTGVKRSMYIYMCVCLLSMRLLSWLELLWRTSTAIYCDLKRTQIISVLRYQTHSEASFRRNVCSIQFIEYYVRVVQVMTSWLVDASSLFMLLKEGATHFPSFSQPHSMIKCVYIYIHTQYTYWQYIYIISVTGLYLCSTAKVWEIFM